MGLSTFDETRVLEIGRILVAANGTTAQQLVAGLDVDCRVDSVVAINGDTIAHVIYLSMGVGGSATLLGSVSVPAQQGLAGTPGVDILAAILPSTQVGVLIPPGQALNVMMAVAVTGSNAVHCTAFGGYF